MASKKLTWAILGLCGSLLALTVSTATQAADQPAKQAATSDAKQDTLMCRDLEIPGSHIKQRVCGVPAKWSEVGSSPLSIAGESGCFFPLWRRSPVLRSDRFDFFPAILASSLPTIRSTSVRSAIDRARRPGSRRYLCRPQIQQRSRGD